MLKMKKIWLENKSIYLGVIGFLAFLNTIYVLHSFYQAIWMPTGAMYEIPIIIWRFLETGILLFPLMLWGFFLYKRRYSKFKFSMLIISLFLVLILQIFLGFLFLIVGVPEWFWHP